MQWNGYLFSVATAAFLGTACVGEMDVTGPDTTAPATPDAGSSSDEGTTPRAMFATTVQPIVSRCAGSSCHTGTGSPLKFLGTDSADDDYDSLIGHPSVTGGFDPSLANLLLKVEPGDHYGMTYSDAERSAIVSWLDAELVARESQPDDPEDDPDEPPLATNGPLAAWSGCMTKANWDAAQMGSWSDKDAEGNDECATCHNDGAFRFNTNDTNDEMFTMNRTKLYIIGFFTVRVNPDGSETVIPAYQKLERMGDGSTLHPRFGYGDGDTYFERLQQFYELTLATQEAGQCGPPLF